MRGRFLWVGAGMRGRFLWGEVLCDEMRSVVGVEPARYGGILHSGFGFFGIRGCLRGGDDDVDDDFGAEAGDADQG